ncbi:MAG: DNA-binding protein [Anaerolineales bacterium]|jgi:A/G-specific adenine glycosylase
MSDSTPYRLDWINDERSIQSFRDSLIVWGQINFRSFPWRMTQDPYHTLIAEVMLHRTQVAQVVPIYQDFIKQYPNLKSLARASLADLTKELTPLGLHWRVNLIYKMVQTLAIKFNNFVPQEKTDLLSLPGVNEYVACAVRCFSWNMPEAIVDTNTVRIVGRIFGWEVKDSSRRNKKFRMILATLVDKVYPRVYNYALLDLAHLICTKRQPPACDICPIVGFCMTGQAFKHSL